MKTRISIIEDDGPTRQILTEIIASTPTLELVSQYERCAPAIKALPEEGPDVVLVDINLPEMNGVDAVKQLKVSMPNTQFLMLTVYEDADHIFAALAAGATGYLLKGTRRKELLEAITDIRVGGSPMSSGIARKVVQSFSRSGSSTTGRSELDTLSPREQSVLALLTKGYLYKEIADSLGVSGPTVTTYIRRIYEKLQVHSRTQAITKYLQK
ncbi:DNA-binding response regulator [Nibricoccus aquaticus]|uniref:DNA-binding response regulator n=1 Tax=Nibricoccus aquaticus TaxID=2576891 RepID=A0A290Q5L9_9BACT|nr:response regulator transcription factor [Nibricoccus aquaticus]ATC63733.1 DNA-binding response regulator [Nibricoccus aquaticus]